MLSRRRRRLPCSAGLRACCIADLRVGEDGSPRQVQAFAGWEACDTAGSEACATITCLFLAGLKVIGLQVTVVDRPRPWYSHWPVNRLTKQEQMVLCVLLGLLLTGWVVKTYRAAHPPAQAVEPAKP